jgi:hypothetical protein
VGWRSGENQEKEVCTNGPDNFPGTWDTAEGSMHGFYFLLMPVSGLAAVTKFHHPGGLGTIEIYFSGF